MAEVELFGEFFSLNPREDYEWAMMDWAEAAVARDLSELEQMALIKTFLHAAITAEDWGRFEALRRSKKAQIKRDLLPIVVVAFQQASERPTGRPSDSSDGPSTTPESSEVASYRRVIEREEASGRPDRALMVLMAQESTSA